MIKQMFAPRPVKTGLPKNWAMRVGGGLVLLVLALALFAPLFAPADPMVESYVAERNGRFIRPPFPPGVQGYPLGSDEYGRDTLSRLMWAIRPTMTLVVVVSALRLAIGILLGLLAGWSNGRVGRFLDTLISGALSVPVLFVALCVIAALGSRWGVMAFILGLSITGWAEAARMVQEATRSLKNQPFIEATRAMGGNGGQIVLDHILPHVLPLVWIQLAFEASAALLTTAALGFLGYYISAVWIPIGDFTGLRASGTPELGQMLGVSTRNQPWTAMSAGMMVFLVVLAFNLLGEGLRMFLSPERRRRSAAPAKGAASASSILSEGIYIAASRWSRSANTVGAFSILALVILGGGWILWRSQNNVIGATKIEVPGEHLWATELRDAQGTYWSPTRGPQQEPELLWTLVAGSPVVGGPVIDRDGNLYVNAHDSIFSVDPHGKTRWQVPVEPPPVGWPALTHEGYVVMADEKSGLRVFNSQGQELWRYISDPTDNGRAGPVIGPNGYIYYTTLNYLIAIGPNGQREWQIRLPTYSFTSPLPRLSVDGKTLFFEDTIVNAITGERLFNQTDAIGDKYFIGSDGKIYLRDARGVMEWQQTEEGAVLVQKARFDNNALIGSYRFPFDSGVSPSHNPWLLYYSGFEYMRLVWTDPQGGSMQITDFPYREGRLIGIDAGGTAFLCGAIAPRQPVECRSVRLVNSFVQWKLSIDSQAPVAGGAIVDGRIYVTTRDGKLFALGQ